MLSFYPMLNIVITSFLDHAVKIFLYACFFVSLGCYGQSTPLTNPNHECEFVREKARKEVAEGTIVYTMPLGFGSYKSKERVELRCEKELRKLCDVCGLTFSYEMYSDVVFKNQRQGCYGEYMDSIIRIKYGENFKRQLLHAADSILSVSNDTIPLYSCDVRPHRRGSTDDIRLMLEADSTFSRYFQASKPDEASVMYITFLLDKQDKPSGFRKSFVNKPGKADKAVIDELYNLALDELKKISDWQTGTIQGRKVITNTHVKVYFTQKGNVLEFCPE